VTRTSLLAALALYAACCKITSISGGHGPAGADHPCTVRWHFKGGLWPRRRPGRVMIIASGESNRHLREEAALRSRPVCKLCRLLALREDQPKRKQHWGIQH
jgi:hypothetical protein